MKNLETIIPQGLQPKQGEAKESKTPEPKSFGQRKQIAVGSSHHPDNDGNQQDAPQEEPRTSLLGWEEGKLKRPCSCGCEYAWAIPRPDTIHHAALHCQVCDRFCCWQAKPKKGVRS